MIAFLLAAALDPIVILVSTVAVLVILLGLLLRKIGQPYIIGYILIGALVEPQGLEFATDLDVIRQLGDIGIILLLFFIGMEINLPDFVKQWKVALFGTISQVLISVLCVLGIGYFLDWTLYRSIILGFVICLSSSAIIIKIIEDKKLLTTKLGKDVLTILLTQDIIIVPLLIITSLLGGESESIQTITMMIVGGLAVIGVLVYIYVKKEVVLPFSKSINSDHELQVFLAIFFCFGGAVLSGLFGISAALGAFVGGMVIHAAKSGKWIHDTLHPFRVIFVAFFFISIGMQLNFNFITGNLQALLLVLLAVYITNHLINMLILRWFSETWREALYGGALLAQIGEMSFLVCSTAFAVDIIGIYAYDFTICLISLTLIISPFWVTGTEILLRKIMP